jgi:pimeloyl-ACP methyl ester carboxylesterase
MILRGVRVLAVLAMLPLPGACAPLFAPEEHGPASRQVDAGAADAPLRLAMSDAGQGKPVLLIHGLGASSYTWREVAPALARRRRVIAIDLKGFGESDKPKDGKYSILDQAELIKSFIKKENLHNLTVAGHSYGGGVALALALKFADEKDARIERLALIDSLAYKQPIPFFFRMLQTPVVGDVGFGLTPPEVQTAGALVAAYHDKGKLSTDSVFTLPGPCIPREEGTPWSAPWSNSSPRASTNLPRDTAP